MLPIRDLNPSRTTPFINWLMIGICVLTFFLVQTDDEQLYQAASIPCEISTGEAAFLG